MREPQAVQHLADPRVYGVAVEPVVLVLRCGHGLHQAINLIEIAGGGSGIHFILEPGQLGTGCEHSWKRREHLVFERDTEPALALLGQVAERVVGIELDEPIVGAALAGNDLQERGLAGAVVADQPNALFRPDEERDLVEHFLAAIADGDIVDV